MAWPTTFADEYNAHISRMIDKLIEEGKEKALKQVVEMARVQMEQIDPLNVDVEILRCKRDYVLDLLERERKRQSSGSASPSRRSEEEKKLEWQALLQQQRDELINARQEFLSHKDHVLQEKLTEAKKKDILNQYAQMVDKKFEAALNWHPSHTLIAQVSRSGKVNTKTMPLTIEQLQDVLEIIEKELQEKDGAVSKILEAKEQMGLLHEEMAEELREKIKELKRKRQEMPDRTFAMCLEAGDYEACRSYIRSHKMPASRKRFVNQQLSETTKLHPLHVACHFGHLKIVNLLLEYGADINQQDGDKYTPLFWAAKEGHVEIVELLLKKGAQVNLAGQFGRTPLHAAAYNGKSKVVELLLDHGADPNSKTGPEDPLSTPLQCAVARGHMEVVELLLSRGATLYEGVLNDVVVTGDVEMLTFMLREELPGQRKCLELLKEARRRKLQSVIDTLIVYIANAQRDAMVREIREANEKKRRQESLKIDAIKSEKELKKEEEQRKEMQAWLTEELLSLTDDLHKLFDVQADGGKPLEKRSPEQVEELMSSIILRLRQPLSPKEAAAIASSTTTTSTSSHFVGRGIAIQTKGSDTDALVEEFTEDIETTISLD